MPSLRRSTGPGRLLAAAALGLSLSLSALPNVAHAQSDQERAGARAAAQVGAEAFRAGRWSEAVEYFKKAESLVHAPPHLLYIARAEEKLRHFVEAREAYLKIKREELEPQAPQAFRDAKAAAMQELAALAPKVPYLSVVVQGAGELPVRVVMNGEEVAPALVGVPVPMNPGTYEFQAFATDRHSNGSTVVLKEGAKETVLLTLQEEGPGDLPPGVAPVAGEPAPHETAAAAPADDPGRDEGPADTGEGGGDGLFIGGLVGIGVGVVGTGLGAVFALSAKSSQDEANDICSQPPPLEPCPVDRTDEVQQLDDDAASARTLATVGFIVGGVGLAAGGTLLVLSLTSGDDSSASEPGITPWVGWQSAGVTGRF